MFTVCPKCALTLVVTAADLKVAQGYVRCGRCSNVFNAIAALTDERQAGMEGYVQPEPPPSPPPAPTAPTPPAEERPPPQEKLEFDPTSTNVSDVFVEPQISDDEATGTFEAIVLETGEPDPTGSDDTATPEQALDRELQSLAERLEAQKQPPAAAAPENIFALAAGLRPGVDAGAGAQRAWAWRAGITMLALALMAQILHHLRHDLAVLPALNGPLSTLYRAIGVPLVPRFPLDAYEVRQLGATVNPENASELIVRASIQNNAAHPQPLPLLRIAVQDRFGNRIATRDVAPDAYAPRNITTGTALAAGQRIDVELSFVDPGSEAVGFEIDACLPAPDGGVNCANH